MWTSIRDQAPVGDALATAVTGRAPSGGSVVGALVLARAGLVPASVPVAAPAPVQIAESAG